MDPRIALADWLGGIGNARENASAYNEWIARGGFPARIAVSPRASEYKDDRYAAVIDVNYKTVTVVFEWSGKTKRLAKHLVERVLV